MRGMNSTIKLLAKLYQIDFVAVFSCTQKNKLELKTKTDQENLFLPEDQLFLEDIILNNTIAKNGFYITHKKEYKTHTKEFPNHFSSLFIIPIFSKKEKILGYVIAFHTKEIDLCDDKKAQLELYSSSIQHMWQQQIAEFEIQQVSDVIIDSVPEAISFHELPSQKTIAINRAFEEYTGYTKEEVYGQTGLDLDLWAKESERQEYQKLIAHSGQIKNFEASFKNRKGEVFFGQASTLITKYLGKDHLLLVIRNITLLKKAKSELKESEEKFRKIFDFLPDYLSIHDYNNYDFVDINNSFMDRLGFSRDQLIGENVFDMGMWNHTEQRNEYLRLIKKHGETYNFEAEFNTPHNKKITGLISAKTIILNGKPHYLVVTRDINNIKEYQRKLQESEIRFRAIVEQSPASIIILNSKGIFIYSNPKTKELFGYSSEDLLGEEFIKFTNSPNKYSLLKKIKNHQKLDDSDYFEFQILHKNGKIRDAQMQAATFIDEQGQTKTIIQLLDITDKIDKLRIINRSRAVTFLWKNAPGFPVQHVSANVHKLLGYSADEFLRFKIEYSHIIHPDDLPIVLKEQEIHLKDKDASFINHQRKGSPKCKKQS
ncbi:MAG: hypothetical protein B7C24_04530 [Bacteroidetes bacterium 4572_77]|nr:MAG: hypothetical protein B7C24_04530 [Bacteroidetes bacterium 4572_77]